MAAAVLLRHALALGDEAFAAARVVEAGAPQAASAGLEVNDVDA
jgi:hypothetical protein